MSNLLIAESLFLLMHDAGTGRWRSAPAPQNGLAGALLLDLVERELIQADGRTVTVCDVQTGHPLLRSTLEVIQSDAKPRAVTHWVRRLPSALKPLDRRVGFSLVQRGVVSETRNTVLGLFPTTRWPAIDEAPGRALRARLAAVLTRAAEPDPRESLLIALLGPLGLVGSLVERPDRRTARTRAKEITDLTRLSRDTSAAVAQAVHAIHAGVATAAAASSVAASS